MATQLRSVEAVKVDRSAAALSVSDLAGKDRRPRRFIAPFAREILISDPLDQHVPQSVGCTTEHFVAGRIRGVLNYAPLVALLVDDTLGTYDDHILLQFVQLQPTLY